MRLAKFIVAGGFALALSGGMIDTFAQPSMIVAGASKSSASTASEGQLDLAAEHYFQRIHDALGFTNEADWNVVKPLVKKVYDAQRDLTRGSVMSHIPVANVSTNSTENSRSVQTTYFGKPSPEAEALQRAVDVNASTNDIAAALETYRASQKAKRAKLEEAQANLRKVLTLQQQAEATLLKVID